MDLIDEIIYETFRDKSFTSETHDPTGYFFKFQKDIIHNLGKGETNSIKPDHQYYFGNRKNIIILIEKELTKRPVESISKYLFLFDAGHILKDKHPFLIPPFSNIPLDISETKYMNQNVKVYYKDYQKNFSSELRLYFIFSGYALDKPVCRYRSHQVIYLGKLLERELNKKNIATTFNYRFLESGAPKVSALDDKDRAILSEDLIKLIPE